MPLTPDAYLKNTLMLFPPGTMVLMVTPAREGDWQAHLRGCADCDPGQALEILAAAQVMLERQTATVIAAAAEAAKKTEPEMLEYFQMLVARQNEDTREDHEASTVTVKTPKLRLGNEGLVDGAGRALRARKAGEN